MEQGRTWLERLEVSVHTAPVASMMSASPGVSLADFLAGLFATGQVAVGRGVDLAAGTEAALAVLKGAFVEMLDDLPEFGTETERGREPLQFDAAIGLAAARYLYQVSLALADRAMTEAQVAGVCGALPPVPDSVSAILSADLTLRHLPELDRMARAMSEDDPLVTGLQLAAARFPLSAVGIPLKGEPDVDLRLVRRDKVLWQLYLDRVLERQDAARMQDPAVQAGVRDALGLHAGLAPRLSAQLALADA